jgi:hypothetical protein
MPIYCPAAPVIALSSECNGSDKDESEGAIMYLQVDIYQCESNHIHVILGGRGEGEVTFSDFDTFVKFSSICHEFANKPVPIPGMILEAFADEEDA